MKPSELHKSAATGRFVSTEEAEFIRQTANSFDGMMADLSIILFTLLIRDQAARGGVGDFVEFGVLRGKSAAVAGLSAPPDAKIHLIDKSDYPERDKLSRIHPNFNYYLAWSEELIASSESDEIKNIRFSHHDASHYFRNVETEVMFIKDRMSKYGLIVLDDFGFGYSQVIASYFYMRYIHKIPYEVFLIAGNKAYLCHEDDFLYYEKMMCDRIIDELEQCNLRMTLVRTDNDKRHRAFNMSGRSSADAPKLYGVNTWGMTFYTPGAKPYEPA